MRRPPRDGLGLPAIIFIGLVALLVLAELEYALRPAPAIGLIDGTLLEAIAVSGPLLVALLSDAQFRSIVYCLLGVMVLIGLGRRVRRGERGVALVRWTLRCLALLVLGLWTTLSVALSISLGCRYTGRCALIGLALLVVFVLLRRRSRLVANNVLWGCSTLGALAFFALNLGQHYGAPAVEQQRIYDQAAYDAEQNGAYYVASEPLRQVVVVTPGQQAALEGTWLTQRMCPDPQHETIYAVNYCKDQSMALSAISADQVQTIALSGCDMPVQAQFDPASGSLLVVCEHSCSVHQIDPRDGSRLHDWQVGCLPHTLALDSLRHRVYVSAEVLTTQLVALRLEGDRGRESVYAGLVNWYTAVDEVSGNVFVARGLQGEIAVFDQGLRLIKNIRVGNGPRDLAVDAARRLLLCADYFSGTLTVIDLERLEPLRQVAVGHAGLTPGRIELRIDLNKFLLRRLRGVSVTPDGMWLVSDATGVWEIDPGRVLGP